MLDIKFVRGGPDIVKQNIKNKFQDEKLPLVDEVIELDKKNLGNDLNLILLKEIGNAEIVKSNKAYFI